MDHAYSRAMAAIPLIPVSGTVTSYNSRGSNNYVICAVVTDHVKVTIIKPLDPVIPNKPLGLLQHLIVYISSAHSVLKPLPRLIILSG